MKFRTEAILWFAVFPLCFGIVNVYVFFISVLFRENPCYEVHYHDNLIFLFFVIVNGIGLFLAEHLVVDFNVLAESCFPISTTVAFALVMTLQWIVIGEFIGLKCFGGTKEGQTRL